MGFVLALATRRAWGGPAYGGDMGPSFPPQRQHPQDFRVMQELILHSLRKCFEVSGRITVLLLWVRTREKETFTALRNLVPTCRESSDGHQIPLMHSERLGKYTQGSCNLVDAHCRP